MPPFIALAIAGAGLYAGYRWISRELQRSAAEAGRMRDEADRMAREHMAAPRDLGSLEWDAAAGVYRPRRQPTS